MDKKIKKVLFHEPPGNFTKRIFPNEMTSEDWMGENKNLLDLNQSTVSCTFILWCVMYRAYAWMYALVLHL